MNNPSDPASTAVSEWRSGWRVLAAAAAGYGMTYGLFIITASLFIVPMQKEFGVSRTALSIGPMVIFVSGPVNIVAGILVRRFGARGVAIFGLLLLACGIVCLSFVPPILSVLYAIVVCIAIAGPLSGAPAYITGVTTWFNRNAGTVIGLTLAGSSVMGVVGIPILNYAIQHYGWRAGYQTMAGLILLPLLLIVPWFREKGRPVGRAEASAAEFAGAAPKPAQHEFTAAECFRDRRFWLLILAIFISTLAIGGFLGQLYPLLLSLNLSPAAAAALGSAFALSIGIGRILSGFLLDHLRPPLVVSACLCLAALGVLLLKTLHLSPSGSPAALLAVALVGLAQGAELDFMAFYALRLFGQRPFPVLLSLLTGVNSCVYALGGLLFARLFDTSGNYQTALSFGIAAFIASALLIQTIKLPPRERGRTEK
jgi:sugar phosphate permease